MAFDVNNLGSALVSGLNAMGGNSPSGHGSSNYNDFLQKIGTGIKNTFTQNSAPAGGSNYSDMMPGSSGNLGSVGLSQTGDK